MVVIALKASETLDFATIAKNRGKEFLATGVAALSEYQARLAAQNTYGLLVCLQALDAAPSR